MAEKTISTHLAATPRAGPNRHAHKALAGAERLWPPPPSASSNVFAKHELHDGAQVNASLSEPISPEFCNESPALPLRVVSTLQLSAIGTSCSLYCAAMFMVVRVVHLPTCGAWSLVKMVSIRRSNECEFQSRRTTPIGIRGRRLALIRHVRLGGNLDRSSLFAPISITPLGRRRCGKPSISLPDDRRRGWNSSVVRP